MKMLSPRTKFGAHAPKVFMVLRVNVIRNNIGYSHWEKGIAFLTLGRSGRA